MNKQDLKQYLRWNVELSRLEEKISEVRNRIEKPKNVNFSEVSSGGVGQHKDFTDYIPELIELQEIYNIRAKKIIAEQIRIETAIAALDDPIERAVLGYKYIDGLTWEQICVKINYGWDRVHHHHRKALANINSQPSRSWDG